MNNKNCDSCKYIGHCTIAVNIGSILNMLI